MSASDPRGPDVSAPELAETGPKRQAQRVGEDCLFCKIVAGEVAADIVADNEHTVAFRDINPQAPTHILVIPREHHVTASELAEASPEAAAALLVDVRAVAVSVGAGDAYRLVFNNGADAGQVIFHAHAHVLAGRPFGWPPG